MSVFNASCYCDMIKGRKIFYLVQLLATVFPFGIPITNLEKITGYILFILGLVP